MCVYLSTAQGINHDFILPLYSEAYILYTCSPLQSTGALRSKPSQTDHGVLVCLSLHTSFIYTELSVHCLFVSDSDGDKDWTSMAR